MGILTFWLGLVQGLNFSMRMIMFFFAGNIIPLNLFPDFIERLVNWLPFKHIVWMPIQVFQRAIELEWTIFLPGLIWLIGLYFLSRFIFKKGIEKYEGFGA